MRTRSESLDPLLDAFEGVLVGQVEAVDDPHHAAEEEIAQRLVLLLACSVPIPEKKLAIETERSPSKLRPRAM